MYPVCCLKISKNTWISKASSPLNVHFVLFHIFVVTLICLCLLFTFSLLYVVLAQHCELSRISKSVYYKCMKLWIATLLPKRTDTHRIHHSRLTIHLTFRSKRARKICVRPAALQPLELLISLQMLTIFSTFPTCILLAILNIPYSACPSSKK